MENVNLDKEIFLKDTNMNEIKELFKRHDLEFTDINVYNYINAINILKSSK